MSTFEIEGFKFRSESRLIVAQIFSRNYNRLNDDNSHRNSVVFDDNFL